MPLYPWSAPPEPWSRVHIDFAGPFEGKMWLIVIDAYSRWLEIFRMSNTTSEQTISALTEIFSRLGYPKIIVSDNGPQLRSEEFQKFCQIKGITHICTTPYHPQTNGIAERAVKTFKQRMEASKGIKSQHERLQSFLLSYRNTVQRSTGRAPSDIIFGRPLRTIFDQLKPDIFRNMDTAQQKQKAAYDKGAKEKYFVENQPVWVNNPTEKGSLPGEVMKQTGPYSYIVNVNGQQKRKHADQLRAQRGAQQLGELEQEQQQNMEQEQQNQLQQEQIQQQKHQQQQT
jgi:hypothetical protein